MIKLNSEQLRQLEEKRARGIARKIKRYPLFFILEDVYDTYNIGGLFRLADALAAEKIYLCGQTETPPNSRIKKASIGTDKIVPFEYKKKAKEAIEELKKLKEKNKDFSNLKILAIEQSEKSIPFYQYQYSLPLAFVVGNESYGVKKETLDLCDKILEIPMYGVNKSLNVIVAASIVSYFAYSKMKL